MSTSSSSSSVLDAKLAELGIPLVFTKEHEAVQWEGGLAVAVVVVVGITFA